MPEYLHPGVYVEEKSSGVRPIEGVSTSTAAFIGATAKGVPNKATFITNWRAFVTKFGDVTRDGPYLPYAVEQFFNNGGKRCYIVRALSDASSKLASVDLPTRETNVPARSSLRINAKGKGAWGNNLSVVVEDGGTNPLQEFRLVVLNEGVPVEVFDDLSLDPNADTYVENTINEVSEYIEVEDLHPATATSNGDPVYATRVTTAVVADPVAFVAGDTLTLTVPSGETVPTLDLSTLVAPVTHADLVSAINTAWAAFNLTAYITAADDSAGANHLRVRSNVAAFDSYFTIGGGATGVGRPLAGLAGFAQGQGEALGATLRTAAVVAGTYAIPAAPNNVLTFTVHGDALPNVTLSNPGAASPIDTVLADLNAAFATTAYNGLLRAGTLVSRVGRSTLANLDEASDKARTM